MIISNIILRTFKKVIEVLDKEKIDWCLFGGLAMQVYKRIRATKDIDLLIEISSDQIANFITCMEKAKFKFDRKRGIIKINGIELLRFFYEDTETAFEIFVDLVTVTAEFQKQIIKRKTKQDFLGIEVNVASLEDVILLKLLADRPIDAFDSQYLIEENIKDIDKDYLKNWARRLKVTKRLNNLLRRNA